MNQVNVYKKTNKTLMILQYIILFFPILGENIISTVLGDRVSKILSVVSCAYIILYAIKRNKIQLCSFNVVMLLLIVHHAIITFVLVSPTTKITVANNIITPYGLIAYFMLLFFIDLNIQNLDKTRVIFKSMMTIMTISVFANLIFTGDLHIANNISVFNEAITTGYTNSRSWLFGHRNMIFIHHLMWILFSYISYRLEKRNYSKLFVFQMFFTMIVAIISWNSTMMFTTFLVFVIAIFRKNFLSKLTIVHYVIIYFILEFGIVFFRIQEVFAFIIVGILNRNLSFTGRTGIWNYYIEQFSNGKFINKLLGNFGETALTVNTHNMFLGLLACTGIVGMVLYYMLLFFSMNNLKKEKDTDTAKFISIIIFGFLINALTMEFYLQPIIAMYLGFRINKINQLIIEAEEK